MNDTILKKLVTTVRIFNVPEIEARVSQPPIDGRIEKGAVRFKQIYKIYLIVTAP